MKISVEQVQADVPVSVVSLDGELDARSYLDVIDKVKTLYQSGTRDLLLDLSNMSFMASSGLVALHSAALIMRGEQPPDPEAGWGAFHAVADEVAREGGREAHIKLLNPQPRVVKTLRITGFDNILDVYEDRQDALTSFSV